MINVWITESNIRWKVDFIVIDDKSGEAVLKHVTHLLCKSYCTM